MGAAKSRVYEVTDADREIAKTVWKMTGIPFEVRANLVCVALSRRNVYYIDKSVIPTTAEAEFILGQLKGKFDIKGDEVFDLERNSEYLFDNEPTDTVGPYIKIYFVVVDEGKHCKGRMFSESTAKCIETSEILYLDYKRELMHDAIQMLEPTFSVELWMRPSLSPPTGKRITL
jgi:hypothetical protein